MEKKVKAFSLENCRQVHKGNRPLGLSIRIFSKNKITELKITIRNI